MKRTESTRTNKTEHMNGTAKYPLSICIVCCFSIALFSLLAVLGFKQGETLVSAGFCCMILLDAVLLTVYYNCRIHYNDNTFEVGNFFGKKRSFRYSDITGVRESRSEIVLILGNEKVEMPAVYSSFIVFYGFAQDKYRQINGKDIPKIRPSENDLFHGNIYNTETYKADFIIMPAVVVLLAAITIICMIDNDKNTSTEAVFFGCRQINDGIELVSDDEMHYIITDISEDTDIEKIGRICDGITKLKMLGRYFDKKGEKYFSVRAITYGDECILSAESTAKVRHREYLCILFIPAGMLVINAIITYLSIIAGRNPKKHPRLAKMLFSQESFVHDDCKKAVFGE